MRKDHRDDPVNIQDILLRSTIESFADVLIFYIDLDFKYLVYNKAFHDATFVAYGTNVKPGLSMLDSITNPEDREKARRNCMKALKGANHITVEVFGEVAEFYFETRYYPVRSSNGEIIGVAVLSSNVTERELARLKIEELIRDLESFSYSVSHDLGVPLRAILGFSDILRRRLDSGPETREAGYLRKIHESALRMQQCMKDLLKFAKIGRSGITEKVTAMTDLVNNSIEELTLGKIEQKQFFQVDKMPPAVCDPGLIRHVYQNLLSNALKFTSGKKTPQIQIGCKIENGKRTYYVRDNGVGFDMRHADRLFKAFERLHSDKEFEGSGIGLALAGRIINKHKGKIWAESKPGKGATFYFSLPVKVEKAAPESG